MAISYAKVSKTPYVFRQLTGLTTSEFEKIVEKVRPEWEKVEVKKKCHGRKSHVEKLEDKILCVLQNVHNASIFGLFVQPAQLKYLPTFEENGAVISEKNYHKKRQNHDAEKDFKDFGGRHRTANSEAKREQKT